MLPEYEKVSAQAKSGYRSLYPELMPDFRLVLGASP
jgi:hypothetical protein